MLDQIRKNIGIISLVATVVDILLAVVGLIGQFMDKQWFWGVYVTLSVFLIVCLVVMVLDKREEKSTIKQLQEDKDTLNADIELLTANICAGLEFLSNQVTIEFIKGATEAEHKYKFIFSKKCRVVGESKWYSGQVYFNNQLQNEQVSESFYEKNPNFVGGTKCISSYQNIYA